MIEWIAVGAGVWLLSRGKKQSDGAVPVVLRDQKSGGYESSFAATPASRPVPKVEAPSSPAPAGSQSAPRPVSEPAATDAPPPLPATTTKTSMETPSNTRPSSAPIDLTLQRLPPPPPPAPTYARTEGATMVKKR